MRKTVLNLILISLLSCSTAKIKSNNKIEVSLDKKETHTNDIEIKVDKDFFLWGYYPNHEILIDEKFLDKGFDSVSSFEFAEETNLKNFLWALFTFGVYYPQTYILKAKSKDG